MRAHRRIQWIDSRSAGLFGAALLYGDGMITPAISVLGALQGVQIQNPSIPLPDLQLGMSVEKLGKAPTNIRF